MSDAQRAKRLVGFCATHLPGSQPVIKSGGWDGTVRGGDAPGDARVPPCPARGPEGGDAIAELAHMGYVVRDRTPEGGLACCGQRSFTTGVRTRSAESSSSSRPAPLKSLLQGRIGNNAADKFRVRKSNLLPHPLDRGEGHLIATAGQRPGLGVWDCDRGPGCFCDSCFRAHGICGDIRAGKY